MLTMNNNSNIDSFNHIEQHQQQRQLRYDHDMGVELDQELLLYLHDVVLASSSSNHHGGMSSTSSPPTLNIFPSHPTADHQGLVVTTTSSSSSFMDDLAPCSSQPVKPSVKREVIGGQGVPKKAPDAKTLRRLAQNREAARKSRLRKKAYVQQLESSRIKLTQLEQELQRARAQGMFFNGGDLQNLPVIGNISTDAAVFDMEYGRWLEEHHRLTCELKAAVQEHLPENDLKMYVDSYLAHYDVVMNLKGMMAKADVFHLVSGMWKTPAERCFMWIGGFRPSELIKVIVNQIEPLTEQQILGVCGLQQSTQEAEEALSQGLESLNQSISETIASDSLINSPPTNMANYMAQMALAINKLSAIEGFVRQADNLRHQTLHRLHQILTTRQAARCFLAIAEYFHRFRTLSSIWLANRRNSDN